MLALVDRFLQAMDRLFFIAANSLLATMLVINIANIATRAVLDQGIIWVFPWTTVLFVWMVFLGFFVLYRRKRDIAIDLLYRNLPDRAQNVVTILTNTVIVLLMGVILSQLPHLLPRQVGHMDYVGLQRYWLAVPFYVSCALIMLDFLRDTAGRVIYGHDFAQKDADPHGQGGQAT